MHFEITVESFRRAAAAAARAVDGELTVIDAQTGGIVFDSEHKQVRGKPLGRPGDKRFVPVVRLHSASGHLRLGAREVAYAALEDPNPHNANRELMASTADMLSESLTATEQQRAGAAQASAAILQISAAAEQLAGSQAERAEMAERVEELARQLESALGGDDRA